MQISSGVGGGHPYNPGINHIYQLYLSMDWLQETKGESQM